jgi:hypothetical protein
LLVTAVEAGRVADSMAKVQLFVKFNHTPHLTPCFYASHPKG